METIVALPRPGLRTALVLGAVLLGACGDDGHERHAPKSDEWVAHGTSVEPVEPASMTIAPPPLPLPVKPDDFGACSSANLQNFSCD